MLSENNCIYEFIHINWLKINDEIDEGHYSWFAWKERNTQISFLIIYSVNQVIENNI